MILIIQILFSAYLAVACPQVSGVYNCTSKKNNTVKVYMNHYAENQINHYSIQNEKALKPIKLVADGDYKEEQEVITDNSGKVIGVILNQTKAQCLSEQELSFQIHSDITYYGQKLQQDLESKLKKLSANSFQTNTVLIDTNNKGKKTTTNSSSLCVKLNNFI